MAKFESHFRNAAAGEVRSARMIEGGDGFKVNATGLDVLPLCYLENDIVGTFAFQPLDYIKLVFQTHFESRVTVGGKAADVGARGGSYIVPEGRSVTEEHPSGYRSLAVRIEPTDLKRKLVALVGAEVPGPVTFDQSPDLDPRFLDFVRKPLFSAVRELDASNPLFHPHLLGDIKEITLMRLLLFARHNFSGLLDREAGAPGRSQMSRAEDYVAANWDKNLDVAALAEAVGISARTILRHFREKHGETPRDYIRGVRLDKARQMFLGGGEEMTVVGVALKCGFSSLGHFAEAYRSRFGELPSETLKGNR